MSTLPQFTQLNTELSASPQIVPQAISEIISLGYKSIINNRPDNEEAGQPANADLENEAKKLGIAYAFLPVVYNQFTEEQVYKMAELIMQLPQPIFAFCRSGVRTTSIYQLAKKLIAEQAMYGEE